MNLFISRRGKRHALLVGRIVMVGTALAALCGSQAAFAQAAASGSDEPVQAQPEMQQQAVDALNKLGSYLRSLKSFRIVADSVTDAVLTTGQNVGFLHRTEMSVQRPNKVRVVVTGSRAPKGFIYDGHTFVLFNDTHNYYSRVPAPPTIRELITDADQKYGVQFRWSTCFTGGDSRTTKRR